MAAITMEHRHARYAGVAQIVLGVAVLSDMIGGGPQLDLWAPLAEPWKLFTDHRPSEG